MENQSPQTPPPAAAEPHPPRDFTPALNAALAKAQAEYPEIPKTKKATVPLKSGGQYSYFYADIADVLRIIRPILAKHELSVTQRTRPTSSGLMLLSELRHASGEVLPSSLPLPNSSRPQELGSDLTYYRRYAFCSLTGCAADEDDDANISAGKAAETTSAGAKGKAKGKDQKPADPPPDQKPNVQAKAAAKPKPKPYEPPATPKGGWPADRIKQAQNWVIPFGKEIKNKRMGAVDYVALLQVADWIIKASASRELEPAEETFLSNFAIVEYFAQKPDNQQGAAESGAKEK